MVNTIETEHVVIRWISVSEMENNVYLITAKETGAQVLIDAADDIAAIEELIAAGAEDTSAPPILEAIITTHRHWDHIRALPAAAEKHPDAMTIAGAADAAAITEAEGVEIAHSVDHLDVGDFGGFVLQAIGLRGHTPGSIALLLRDGERRSSSPAIRSSRAARGRHGHRRTSPRSWTTSRSGSSSSCPMTRRCCPVMVRRQRSALSGDSWGSGANAGGEIRYQVGSAMKPIAAHTIAAARRRMMPVFHDSVIVRSPRGLASSASLSPAWWSSTESTAGLG